MKANEEIQYWVNEFDTQYGDGFVEAWAGEEDAEEIIERALESFESELRQALHSRIQEILDERGQEEEDNERSSQR